MRLGALGIAREIISGTGRDGTVEGGEVSGYLWAGVRGSYDCRFEQRGGGGLCHEVSVQRVAERL